MTTRTEKDRSARRAIGWGAAILLIGFVVGAMVTFVPVATGMAIEPAFGLDWIVVLGSAAVSLVGLGFIIYGFVQLGRSRPAKAEREREREAWRRGPFTRDDEVQSS